METKESKVTLNFDGYSWTIKENGLKDAPKSVEIMLVDGTRVVYFRNTEVDKIRGIKV